MTTEAKERAPAAVANKVRRQRVQIRKLQARIRELEAELAIHASAVKAASVPATIAEPAANPSDRPNLNGEPR